MSIPKAEAIVDAELGVELYRRMLRIRRFEEQVNDLYRAAKMPGLAHLYIGEEAVAVGVCAALSDADYITSTHRGHGHCLAKGAELNRMFAELLGKEAGYCHGKGGSMHIADTERGNLGANAIVAGSAGIATGAALSAKKRGSGQVAVCFFGDGALGQGVLYEAMNMASLWKLPVVYVCEDNQYNEYTHFSESIAGEIGARARAFAIPVEEVDGQAVQVVYAAATKSVARARAGEGPTFLLCHTYRFLGHHVGDVDRAYYRSAEEEQGWRDSRDPIRLAAALLADEGGVSASRLDQLEEEIQTEVKEAVEYALEAPYPQPGEVTEDVYA
jgi:acetoin:2,6-dichlorophenolindophenol oxidoreductase subunit alpha